MRMCFGSNAILLVELSNSGPYALISVEVLGRPRIYAQPAPCINQYQCVPHGDALIVVPKSIHIRRVCTEGANVELPGPLCANMRLLSWSDAQCVIVIISGVTRF